VKHLKSGDARKPLSQNYVEKAKSKARSRMGRGNRGEYPQIQQIHLREAYLNVLDYQFIKGGKKMKRRFEFFLVMATLFLLCACEGEANNAGETLSLPIENAESTASDETVKWALMYYIDDFKEPTEKWYIKNEESFWGTFDNSATENSELAVTILVDEDVLSIVLYEYGDRQVKNTFFDYQIDYDVKIRVPDHDDFETTGFMYASGDSGDRIFIESPGKDFIIDALQANNEIKFSIESKNSTYDKYFFSVPTGNFSEIYESASVNAENTEKRTVKPDKSKEEIKYERATKAEERGYYTIAKNIFGEILDYQDSQEHYNKLNDILREYNGTYYGESAEFKNVHVFLYFEDGSVSAQFEGMEKSPSKYELYLYGQNQEKDNAPILAFSEEKTSLFSIDTDITYGDGFSIQLLDDGSYLVAATEGSKYHTWNGFYEKVSDTIE
jgi:hypothetical protein